MKPNMQWSPPVIINESFDESYQSAKLHIDETTAVYEKQYMVNLIDKQRSQGRLGRKFTEIIEVLNNPNVKYYWLDYHAEIKKVENISKLVGVVFKELTDWGHFICELKVGMDCRADINADTCQVKQRQSGVMRTNCMDCLDRTNVVQSVFSRKILQN